MGGSEMSPDSRQVVEDLEDEIVDVDRLRADDADDEAVEETAPDGTRAVPGTPEPPD
jgi:hypothetical protein